MIKTQGLNKMIPLLEAILAKVQNTDKGKMISPFPAIA
jgi:hypothetical protein